MTNQFQKPICNLLKRKKKTTIKPCFEVNNGEIVAHMLYVDHIQYNEMFYYAQLYFNAGVG